MAPKATGAVLATSATTAARTGAKPRATSMTEQIATGAPNPARASKSAPKQKATTRACMRGSSAAGPVPTREPGPRHAAAAVGPAGARHALLGHPAGDRRLIHLGPGGAVTHHHPAHASRRIGAGC